MTKSNSFGNSILNEIKEKITRISDDKNKLDLVNQLLESLLQEKTPKIYVASLRTGPSGKSYFVEFRSPLLILDGQGRKIKRGLGIDYEEANLVVEELNKILSDPSQWYGDIRSDEYNYFRDKALKIFYTMPEVRS